MAKDDYTSAAAGGALKLKGSKPAGIDKKRKKKPKPPNSATMATAEQNAREGAGEEGKDYSGVLEEEMEMLRREQAELLEGVKKTEAERRHEEMRRKRLDERLKREGLKTHKERVEELNKYLSNLSEHHDMPRIGPG